MQEAIERILAGASKRCSQAEVFWVKREATPVEFEYNRLKRIETSLQSGVALRVMKDGKVGFSSTTKPEDVTGLVDNAIATSEFGPPADFSFPEPGEYARVENFDPEVANLSTAQMVSTGEEMVDLLHAQHQEILAGVSMEKVVTSLGLINTAGAHLSHKASLYSVYAQAELISGENFLHVYDGAGGAGMSIDMGSLKQRMTQKIKDGMRNVDLPSGKYPVLMTPLGLQDVLRPAISCVNGSAVLRGFSPWKDRLGEQVLDPRIRLYDDQLRKNAVSSCPFDDEGVPRKRLPIIEDGRLLNFMLDLKTAALLKRQPTASGSRDSVETAPGIGPSTLVVDPGQTAVADLIRAIDRGVIVDVLMGAWSGNPFGGAVNGNIMLGYVVEKGEVIGRVKNAMFSANAFSAMMSQVVGISKEQIDYGQSVYPYILFDGIGIVTKE